MDHETKEMFHLILGQLGKIDQRLDKIENRLDMMDQRLEKVENRLDKVENRLDKVENRLDKVENRLDNLELMLKLTNEKMENLQVEVTLFERNVRRDIHKLNDEMETVIEVLKQKEILPRGKAAGE